MRPFIAACAVSLAALAACGPPATLAPPSAYPSAAAAVEAYERAIARDPTDARALAWLGMLRLQDGRTDEGTDLLGKAIGIDPSLTDAFVALGAEKEKQGDYPAALGLYDAAIQGNPTLRELVQRRHDLQVRRQAAQARLDEAWMMISEGRPDEAMGLLRDLPAELPGEARVHELIARAAVDRTQSLLAYDDRKSALEEGRAAAQAAARHGSANAASLVAVIDSLLNDDTEEMARARERVEEGGETFTRDVCAQQKAPLLTIVNRRGYDLTLDLRFTGTPSQWVVVNDQVALRASPGRDAGRIGVLPRGTAVWVKRSGPDNYVNVLSAVGEGWVARSMLERASFVSFTIRANATLRAVLSPGVAHFRLGRGVKTLAEGREEFAPYLCYTWE